MKISKILFKKLLFAYQDKMEFSLKINGYDNWQKLSRVPKINPQDTIFLVNDVLEVYNKLGGFKLRIPNDRESLFNFSIDFYTKNKK